MKDNFREVILQKTDRELEVISKDCVFYSEEERFLALNELEKRGPLSAEMTEQKSCFDDSIRYTLIPENERPTQKIYKKESIWAGAFLGGPLVAGYLIAENFKAFDESGKARKCRIYALAAVPLLFVVVILIPEDFPHLVIPLAYTAAAYGLVERFQGRNISAHIAAGGQSFSRGKTLLVGLIGCAITINIWAILSLGYYLGTLPG